VIDKDSVNLPGVAIPVEGYLFVTIGGAFWSWCLCRELLTRSAQDENRVLEDLAANHRGTKWLYADIQYLDILSPSQGMSDRPLRRVSASRWLQYRNESRTGDLIGS
jgi:hypothetical protein